MVKEINFQNTLSIKKIKEEVRKSDIFIKKPSVDMVFLDYLCLFE